MVTEQDMNFARFDSICGAYEGIRNGKLHAIVCNGLGDLFQAIIPPDSVADSTRSHAN
jgi:hypothetical protein